MFRWEVGCTVVVDAGAEEVFDALLDLSTWPKWAPVIEWCQPAGPATLGTKGTFKAKGGEYHFTVAVVDRPKVLRADYRLPLWSSGFDELTLTPEGERTRIKFRGQVCGPFTPFIKRRFGREITEEFPTYLRNLGDLAKRKTGKV
jgi:uncharacterized protein YndB with AHSA1/START domain